MTIQYPCEHCPWRKTNHGKKTPWGFYTQANLTRLWGQIRRASGTECGQSCHPTDPNHPDHVAAGAKPGVTPKECPGSVILVYREMAIAQRLGGTEKIGPEGLTAYAAQRKKGMTKSGWRHWLLGRLAFGGTLFGTGPKLPEVCDDPAIDLPDYLKEPVCYAQSDLPKSAPAG
jgi:hypothetical protein